MSIYKVGDWVRCVGTGWNQTALVLDGLYRISDIIDDHGQTFFAFAGIPLTYTFPARFFVKPDKRTLNKCDHKVGDTVRCIDPAFSLLARNAEYIVMLNVLNWNNNVYVKVKTKQGETEIPGLWAQWRFI